MIEDLILELQQAENQLILYGSDPQFPQTPNEAVQWCRYKVIKATNDVRQRVGNASVEKDSVPVVPLRVVENIVDEVFGKEG